MVICILNLTHISFFLSQHSFVKRSRPNNVIKDLIERTKAEVRSLDHQNYKRIKILLKDAKNQSEEADVSGENIISDDDETQTVSPEVFGRNQERFTVLHGAHYSWNS